MKVATATALAAPSVGPAIITIFGTDVPPLALTLSVAGLILARFIAPPPLRKLSRVQELALTALLMIILFLLVTGQLSACSLKSLLVDAHCPAEPLGPGLATVWGIGLGFSGLLAIEFFGQRFMAAFRALVGHHNQTPEPPAP